MRATFISVDSVVARNQERRGRWAAAYESGCTSEGLVLALAAYSLAQLSLGRHMSLK